MSKYLIAMVFLLGLTQNKSEALDLDGMAIIKEVVEISNKYKTCSDTKDNKKRLACFDNLTIYLKEMAFYLRVVWLQYSLLCLIVVLLNLDN